MFGSFFSPVRAGRSAYGPLVPSFPAAKRESLRWRAKGMSEWHPS